MKLSAVGESGVMLYLGSDIDPCVSDQVGRAMTIIEGTLGNELVDLVPSYASILILYDNLTTNAHSVAQRVRQALQMSTDHAATSIQHHRLPVYYDPESGADLTALADAAQLTTEAVIELHTQAQYRVYAIGFAPGFAYLGQVDTRIATPRLTTPRTAVPKGSVAIAERQTAIYPAASPGGWNLIGRCPMPMFEPDRDPPMPLSVGDTVSFESISRDEYIAMGGCLS
ncbi:MAG: 5-oxoprolinase subunit PxpB [Pseudomonadota bacterium]